MPLHHKVLVAGAAVLVLLTVCCCPWASENGYALGYRPLFLPPGGYGRHVAPVPLAAQSILVAVVTAVGVVVTRPKTPPS